MFLTSLLTLAFAVGSGRAWLTDYAPTTGQQCPDASTNPILRAFTPQTQSLNPQEVDYFSARKSGVLPGAWASWLGDGSAIGYNLSSFANVFPNISISISGGGYRASQYGAGVLSGLDARNESALAAGTGGLVQVASYLGGLSGMYTIQFHPGSP